MAIAAASGRRSAAIKRDEMAAKLAPEALMEAQKMASALLEKMQKRKAEADK